MAERQRVAVPSLVIMRVGPGWEGEIERYLRAEGLLPPYRQIGGSYSEDAVVFEGELNPCFVVED